MERISGPSIGLLDSRYVNVTGDTMTGPLVIDQTATTFSIDIKGGKGIRIYSSDNSVFGYLRISGGQYVITAPAGHNLNFTVSAGQVIKSRTFVPVVSLIYDLGSSTLRWGEAHIARIVSPEWAYDSGGLTGPKLTTTVGIGINTLNIEAASSASKLVVQLAGYYDTHAAELYIYSADQNEYIGFYHDGTNAILETAGTAFLFNNSIGIESNNELRFYDNGNYVGFEAPALSADKIWVLPAADGNASEYLQTDGAGNLSWAAVNLSTKANIALDNLASVQINASLLFDADSTYDVGDSTNYAANLYADKIYLNATATLDGATAGRIKVGADLETDRWIPHDSNTVIGIDAAGGDGLTHSTGEEGYYNTFIGYQAGFSITTSKENVGIGYQALYNVSTEAAYGNTAIGRNAARGNTTGHSNFALGSNALYTNQSGNQNIAIGPYSLYSDTAVHFNVAIGAGTLYFNTDNFNVAIGHQCSKFNTSGDSNVAIGYQANNWNATGDDNVMIGFEAAFGVSAQSHANCVVIGYRAAYALTTGASNVIIGKQAGYALTSGASNIFLGNMAGDKQTALSNLLIIDNQTRADVATEITNSILYGVMAAAPASQTLRINANLGIGLIPTANMLGLSVEAGLLTIKETTAPTADSGYGKIWTDTNNELWFQSGAGVSHLLHGDAFSNIWFHGSTTGAMTVEVTISAQNALALINSFTVVGHEDDLLNVVGSASTNNLTLSAIGGGEYEISFHGSVTATGGADKVMLICLGITLATPKDITDVTDDTVSPIVITSIAHGLENGDMVEIVGVLGNDAANGSFIVSNKTDNTFEIIDLSGGATTGDGDFNQGSPTGDVTIQYPGNMIVHEVVRTADLGALSATGLHILANSDKLALYVANLSGTTNLTVSAVSLDAVRIGD